MIYFFILWAFIGHMWWLWMLPHFNKYGPITSDIVAMLLSWVLGPTLWLLEWHQMYREKHG